VGAVRVDLKPFATSGLTEDHFINVERDPSAKSFDWLLENISNSIAQVLSDDV